MTLRQAAQDRAKRSSLQNCANCANTRAAKAARTCAIAARRVREPARIAHFRSLRERLRECRFAQLRRRVGSRRRDAQHDFHLTSYPTACRHPRAILVERETVLNRQPNAYFSRAR